jgi:Arc/MetJ-type ribon-helix-helix transcriptional regulator
MGTQIAVRLDDELAAFVDARVRDGAASSRAAVVKRALERERRRLIAARDAEILARTAADPGLEALARQASHVALDLD